MRRRRRCVCFRALSTSSGSTIRSKIYCILQQTVHLFFTKVTHNLSNTHTYRTRREVGSVLFFDSTFIRISFSLFFFLPLFLSLSPLLKIQTIPTRGWETCLKRESIITDILSSPFARGKAKFFQHFSFFFKHLSLYTHNPFALFTA